ncbi:MAG: hypothetical protein EZS28_008160, partial [Streblomastix strix]
MADYSDFDRDKADLQGQSASAIVNQDLQQLRQSRGNIKNELLRLNMTILSGPKFAEAAIAQGAVPLILEKIKTSNEDGINDIASFVFASLGIVGDFSPSKPGQFPVIAKTIENMSNSPDKFRSMSPFLIQMLCNGSKETQSLLSYKMTIWRIICTLDDRNISNETKHGMLVILTEWLVNRRHNKKTPSEIKTAAYQQSKQTGEDAYAIERQLQNQEKIDTKNEEILLIKIKEMEKSMREEKKRNPNKDSIWHKIYGRVNLLLSFLLRNKREDEGQELGEQEESYKTPKQSQSPLKVSPEKQIRPKLRENEILCPFCEQIQLKDQIIEHVTIHTAIQNNLRILVRTQNLLPQMEKQKNDEYQPKFGNQLKCPFCDIYSQVQFDAHIHAIHPGTYDLMQRLLHFHDVMNGSYVWEEDEQVDELKAVTPELQRIQQIKLSASQERARIAEWRKKEEEQRLKEEEIIKKIQEEERKRLDENYKKLKQENQKSGKRQSFQEKIIKKDEDEEMKRKLRPHSSLRTDKENQANEEKERINNIEYDNRYVKGVVFFSNIAVRNLPKMDVTGKQDPYVLIRMGLDEKQTSVAHNVSNYDYQNERYEMEYDPVKMKGKKEVDIEVWDYDTAGFDDLMGTAKVDILPAYRQWIPIDLYLKPKKVKVDPTQSNLNQQKQSQKKSRIKFQMLYIPENEWLQLKEQERIKKRKEEEERKRREEEEIPRYDEQRKQKPIMVQKQEQINEQQQMNQQQQNQLRKDQEGLKKRKENRIAVIKKQEEPEINKYEPERKKKESFNTKYIKGFVKINNISVRNLPNTDVIGKPDPYVLIRMGMDEKQTSVAHNVNDY